MTSDEPSSREEKLENLMKNQSMILTGVLDEALATVAERMSELPAESEHRSMLDQQLRAEISSIFSEIREEITSEWPKNPNVFKEYISDRAFDKGIKMAEARDFGRPKLTERLDDRVLASYVFLLKSGDAGLTDLFKGLSDWQRSLPRLPWTK